MTGLRKSLMGFMAGSAVALIISFLQLDLNALLPALLNWAWLNLGWSLVIFGILGLLYIRSMNRLSRQLDAGEPALRIAHTEQVLDTWIGLFIGAGVVWTAIGMRAALIHALGNTDTVVETGAYGVLKRMVDGGILLALSTTILGAVGGYLMRLVKTIRLGSRLASS